MRIEANVAGITFRVKEDEAVRKMVPEGEVELRHVPFVHPSDPNRNDPNAVEVWHKGHQLGFLSKGSNERKAYFAALAEGADITCKVTDFSYALYDANLNMIEGTFNDELDGYLASIIIEFDSAVTENHYVLDGKKHIRVTKIAGMIDEIGFVLPKHLYTWITRVAGEDSEALTHQEYLEKIESVRNKGVLLHDACEEFVRDGTSGDHTPFGLSEFVTRFQVKYIDSEKIVRRGKKYRVAGRFDLLADVVDKGEELKVIIDWKRGGSLKLAYMLQCAFYARAKKADGFWIVLFGTKNKCGYSVKKFDKKDIKTLCTVFDALTKIAYQLEEFPQFKMFK
jgi:hypothetical protein